MSDIIRAALSGAAQLKPYFYSAYRYIIEHPKMLLLVMAIWFTVCGVMEGIRQKSDDKNVIIFLWKIMVWMALFCSVIMFLYVTLCNRYQVTYMRYKLDLFWSYREVIEHNNRFVLWQIAWNILAFVPTGNTLYYLFANRRKWYKVFLICAGFSLCIELTQLLGRIGLFEFDDIFHNTLGAMLGYLIGKVFGKIGCFSREK